LLKPPGFDQRLVRSDAAIAIRAFSPLDGCVRLSSSIAIVFARFASLGEVHLVVGNALRSLRIL